jgi:predicted metal-dependent hydrolase
MEPPTPELLTLPTGTAQIHWRRSQRARRVSLRIDPRDGAVVVTLPPRAGRPAGLALLRTHADWVTDRLAALPTAIAFTNDALIPLDGIDHRIEHRPSTRSGVRRVGTTILVSGEAEFLRRRVLDYLRAEARQRFTGLVAAKTKRGGIAARRVTIKDTTSRWGSCAPDGTLAFCWRLVMAPPFVQDYVTAHEVAHLRHMNHGPRFWAHVEDLTVHSEAAIAWLRTDCSRLMRIG